MTTVQIEAQLSTDKLLQAISKMSSSELERFVSEVLAVQAQRRAPSLTQSESELLTTINRGSPVEVRTRRKELIAKRQAETLTPEEQNELLCLTDQIEKAEAERVQALSQLALLRGVSLPKLVQDLGIRAPEHV